MAVAAWLYDGLTAARHDVLVRADATGLVIEGFGRVDVGDLEALPSMDGHVFGHKSVAGWRLGFDAPPPPDIARLLPAKGKYGGLIDRFGLIRTGAVLAVLSSILVYLVLQLPNWIAPHVPMAWERQIGAAMIGDLSGRFCNGPGGQAALDRLVARIAPGEADARVHVIRFPIVNAVTLPGGDILIFDTLLKDAKSPEEVAGVIGHEIGHVRNRDSMQALVRQAGLGILLGGFNGNVGGNLNLLLSTSYSRAAERAADDFSIGAMRRAAVDPRDAGGFFERLAKLEAAIGSAGDALGYVSSHPISRERAARFRGSAAPGKAYPPILARDEWNALVNICQNDPARQSDRPFDLF